MLETNDSIIKGIFLLILAISGNFIGETLGCKTQKMLRENMFAKQMVVYLIIYFVLGFTNENNEHPLRLALNALGIWILFISFTRMSLFFTMLVFILITIRYIFIITKQYYNEKSDSESIVKLIETISINVDYSIMFFIIIGFILYFRKQYIEYYKEWSTYKFIFGVNKCKSM
tara:strand:- start:702 stop:1220 length:519 start_codon:yes stop_codon:yes gene_type:complete